MCILLINTIVTVASGTSISTGGLSNTLTSTTLDHFEWAKRCSSNNDNRQQLERKKKKDFPQILTMLVILLIILDIILCKSSVICCSRTQKGYKPWLQHDQIACDTGDKGLLAEVDKHSYMILIRITIILILQFI